MMKKKIKYIGVLSLTALLSSVLTAAICYYLAIHYVLQPFQKEAVDRDYASWFVTDTATGATQFDWNEVIPENNIIVENQKILK